MTEPMPQRGVRVSDETWNQAKAKAEKSGLDISSLIRLLLEKFNDGTIIVEKIIKVEIKKD